MISSIKSNVAEVKPTSKIKAAVKGLLIKLLRSVFEQKDKKPLAH